MVDTMRGDFEYWYPFDFRNSAKDLLQNHLAFCVFNHTAIFPKKHWPKSYGLNGRIMVNNEKMSKSKGNFFTARELYTLHGPDIVRLTSANAGEGVDEDG
jgi:leucyl-tRNA synthetase